MQNRFDSKKSGGKLFTSPLALSVAFLFAGMANGQAPVEFTDGTGTIRIRVKTCDWAPSQLDAQTGTQVAETSCGADDDNNDNVADWDVVGGGAEICCLSGATLTRNAPDTDNLWYASTSGSSAHQVRAWAVLMQLVDGMGQPFRPSVQVMDDNTELCKPDNAGVCINYGIQSRAGNPSNVLIGAGAQIQPEGQATGGLTESRPVVAENGEIIWKVGARLGPNDVSVRAWLVSIDPCPEQWDGECLSTPFIKEAVSNASAGYNSVTSALGSSWIPTSIGGHAIAQGNEVRYLDDLVPLAGSNRGFTVQSKPGSGQNSGSTLGSALVIGRSMAPYQFNAVRFQSAGTALYRHPSSTRLWQTHEYPLNDRGRWHLDRVAGSVPTVYLLRNGNPDGGSQCGYWAGGNDVRVAACEEGNSAFHWFKIGESVFQLQSDQSPNLCLDNGNQGSVSSALRVQTCTNGYSPQQALFLDAYDWPIPASQPASPFRFESLSHWTSTAPLSLNPNLKTEGQNGLSVGGANFRFVNSQPFRTPIAGFGSRLLLDVYVPGQQPNPYWSGAVQVYASCPSVQMDYAYIGQADLTGRPTGAFATLGYDIPAPIRSVLSQTHEDCSFHIGVNMNATPTHPVLDNLRFAP